jgi:hypothetical protein
MRTALAYVLIIGTPSLEPGRVGSCITLFEACSALFLSRRTR